MWLGRLPALLEAVAGEWDVQLGQELRGGILACVVATTTRSGEQAVLKLAGPWNRPADEIACLTAWAGVGAPRLLRADPSRGALLLERIAPATAAADATPAEVATVLESLRRPVPAGLRPLAEVARRRVLKAAGRGRPAGQVDRALAEIDALGRDAGERALCTATDAHAGMVPSRRARERPPASA